MRTSITLRGPATRRATAASVALICAVGATACGDERAEAPGPTVVATTPQLADLARNVAGERAAVETLLPATGDPHEYEPRPSDAAALADAALVLRSGGDVDLWLGDLVESSGTGAEILTLLDVVEPIAGGHAHAEGEPDHASAATDDLDPHWWHDPRNAILAVEAIRDALVEADPAGASDYERNADTYVRALERLDRSIAACFDSIPPHGRSLVTTHDSLGYLAHRYDLEVTGAALPALTTQAQASTGETAELIDRMEDAGVAAVFTEAGLSSDLERAIAAEAGVRVGGELYADTLGPEGSGADTYAGAMAANARVIGTALGGDPSACEVRP